MHIRYYNCLIIVSIIFLISGCSFNLVGKAYQNAIANNQPFTSERTIQGASVILNFIYAEGYFSQDETIQIKESLSGTDADFVTDSFIIITTQGEFSRTISDTWSYSFTFEPVPSSPDSIPGFPISIRYTLTLPLESEEFLDGEALFDKAELRYAINKPLPLCNNNGVCDAGEEYDYLCFTDCETLKVCDNDDICDEEESYSPDCRDCRIRYCNNDGSCDANEEKDCGDCSYINCINDGICAENEGRFCPECMFGLCNKNSICEQGEEKNTYCPDCGTAALCDNDGVCEPEESPNPYCDDCPCNYNNICDNNEMVNPSCHDCSCNLNNVCEGNEHKNPSCTDCICNNDQLCDPSEAINPSCTDCKCNKDSKCDDAEKSNPFCTDCMSMLKPCDNDGICEPEFSEGSECADCTALSPPTVALVEGTYFNSVRTIDNKTVTINFKYNKEMIWDNDIMLFIEFINDPSSHIIPDAVKIYNEKGDVIPYDDYSTNRIYAVFAKNPPQTYLIFEAVDGLPSKITYNLSETPSSVNWAEGKVEFLFREQQFIISNPFPLCNENSECDPGEEYNSACYTDCYTLKVCNHNQLCDEGEQFDPDCVDCGTCNFNGACDIGETSQCQDCFIECNNNGVCDIGEGWDENCIDCFPKMCDPMNIDCSNPACSTMPQCAPVVPPGGYCDPMNVVCSNPACSSMPQCAAPPGYCGDNICGSSETPIMCPSDCQASVCNPAAPDCTNPACAGNPSCAAPSAPYCGDSKCDSNIGETSVTCLADCPAAQVSISDVLAVISKYKKDNKMFKEKKTSTQPDIMSVLSLISSYKKQQKKSRG